MTTTQLSERVSGARQARERDSEETALRLSDSAPTSLYGTAHQGEPVLLLTSHPGALSLISTFVAISGHDPLVPLDDESIEQAVHRIRPRVSIVDFEHPGAASQRVEGHLVRAETRVILFSTWHRSLEARARAMSMNALFFALPIEHDAFAALLQAALLA